jgi:hypothetical protein
MVLFKSLTRLNRNLKFWRTLVVSFFPMLLMGLLLKAAGPAFAEEKVFQNPKVNGYALDLCRSWSKDCGKPAADAWCKKAGYLRALQFKVKEDSPPTRVISSGKVCNAPSCDRIISVTCEAEPGTRGKFDAGGEVIMSPDEFEKQ